MYTDFSCVQVMPIFSRWLSVVSTALCSVSCLLLYEIVVAQQVISFASMARLSLGSSCRSKTILLVARLKRSGERMEPCGVPTSGKMYSVEHIVPKPMLRMQLVSKSLIHSKTSLQETLKGPGKHVSCNQGFVTENSKNAEECD